MRKFEPATVFVAIVWLAMTVSAFGYLARFAASCPFQDDLEIAVSLADNPGITLEWLWSQHNDHRQPLPLLVYGGLLGLTGDCRSGMYFQVVVLALVSLGLILVARKVRGRSSATDAFFPLLLQHTGNCENLLLGFQLALAIQTALVCGILMIVAAGPPRPAVRTSLAIGLLLLGLPLSMAHGLVQAPPLAAWMALAGLGLLGSRGPVDRAGRRVLLGMSLAAGALMALYVRGFRFSPVLPGAHSEDLASTLRITFRMLALSIGPGAMDYWPLSGWLAGALALATAALLVATLARHPSERFRASGILACLGASIFLSVCIGWGRGGMFEGNDLPNHYVTLTAPLLCTIYIAWTRYGPAPASRFVRIGLLACAVALADFNARLGRRWGEERRAESDAIARDVEAGMSPEQLAEFHWGSLYPGVALCADRLEVLHLAGTGPFRGRPYEANLGSPDLPFPMFRTQPGDARSDKPMYPRTVDGMRVLLVHTASEIEFLPRPGTRILRASFGVSPDAIATGRTDGVRFAVERVVEGHPPEVLFERILDPVARPKDRGTHTLAVDLPQDGQGRILLRTSNLPEKHDEMDWAYWTDVRIE